VGHGTTTGRRGPSRDCSWCSPAVGSLACEQGGVLDRLPNLGDVPKQVNGFLGGESNMLPSVSVVVPALNEARNIPYVFARMPPDVHEVLLVDGFSVDDTVIVARQLRPDVHVIPQTRRGKGNALACGFAAATGDIIAMVDADGSADPGEIPRFVEALLDGADFAKGTRFAEGGGSDDITPLRSFGNYGLTAFFNACYGRNYSDLCYGFNVFWRRHVPVLGLDATSPPPTDGTTRLWGDGFEVETLIHVRVAKAGLVVAEIPSFEHARIHGVSNLNACRDGLRVLRTILTERRHTSRPTASVTKLPIIYLAGNQPVVEDLGDPGRQPQLIDGCGSTAPPALAAGQEQ
jgi:Glycosyl transferase family 2